MKYLNKRFTSPANSKEFVENWDAVFGDEPTEPPEPPPKKWATEIDPKFRTKGVGGVPFDI